MPNQELSPSWGYFDAYDGSGYVADLGYNSSTAQAVISELPNNFETFTHNSLQSARLHNDVLISRFLEFIVVLFCDFCHYFRLIRSVGEADIRRPHSWSLISLQCIVF